MTRKKSYIRITIVLILIVLLFPNFIFYSNAVDEVEAQNATQSEENENIKESVETKIEVSYEYDAITNTVIATMESNKKLQDTKPSWTLSEDGLRYTKIFTENMNYVTDVTDIEGTVIQVEINVTQIYEETKIEVSYKYDSTTNTVIVTMKSNKKLQDTKPSWALSEDGLRYTKTFTENMSYVTDVTDIEGIVIPVKIEVTQISEETRITVSYNYDTTTNTVIATMKSNKKLQDTKPSWTLSKDGLTYTKIFSENMNYATDVVDIEGAVIKVEINVTQITEIKVYYEYDLTTNTVTTTVQSSKKLQDTKPSWTLSEDGLCYTKTFTANMTYTTDFVDIDGTTIKVEIDVIEIDDRAPEITQEYIRNEDNTITVILHSNERLGNTKPSWTMSEDELSYSKVFNENMDYETALQDIWGNEVMVRIKVLISNFESLDESKYPGYKTLLRQLQNKHPDWIITIKYTGLDWNAVIENEYGFSGSSPRSLTQSPYLNEWKSSEDDNTYDVSKTWYRASKKAIAYMMDPRNSLEEAWLFQFQDLASSAGTRANIKQMVSGTYLDTDSIVNTILATAQEQNISPFHLVSRMLQEQGRDGSGVMNGYEYNGRKVYNLFNINVSGNSEAGITAGAQYAYERHWFTPETCIMGSAEFLKKNYISKGQSTLYFQKYNVVYSPLYDHQYMQNIRAANDEGYTIYKSYRDNGLLDCQFEFVIPVYENMPTTACLRPAQ